MRDVRGSALATGLPLAAQLDPEDAQVISYFPQLADGGDASQQWSTALTFVNPHGWIPAAATAWFYGNDGKPLMLDLGAGPVSTFLSSPVPPQGMVSYKTTRAVTAHAGWLGHGCVHASAGGCGPIQLLHKWCAA